MVGQEVERIMNSSESAIELKQELKVKQDFYLELCGHVGKIIKIYDNGDIAVRCPESHEKDPLTGDVYKGKIVSYTSKFSFLKLKKTIPKSKRNLVYIIGTR